MLLSPLIHHPSSNIDISTQTRIITSRKQFLQTSFLLCLFYLVRMALYVKLMLSNDNYPQSLTTWLVLFTIYDSVNLLLTIWVIILYFRSHRNRDTIQVEGSLGSEAPMNNKQFFNLLIMNNCYHHFLFGLSWYRWLNPCIGCFSRYQGFYAIMCFNLYMGFLFIGFCLIKAIDHKDISRLFTSSLFGFKLQGHARKKAPINLPIKTYSSDMEPTECYICLSSYNEGDKLVELSCNSKHYFHEECIKKWVQIKDLCPLCRQSIESISKLPKTWETELQSTV